MCSPEFSSARGRRAQSGASLIELLVGLTLGLMVVAAAIGTLIVSRTASGTVGDLSQLQQQGSYALRVVGIQIRQAGSVAPIKDSVNSLYSFKDTFIGFGGNSSVVTGADGAGDSADTVSTSNEPLDGNPDTRPRDCLGEKANGARIDSTFWVDGEAHELKCKSGAKNQALIGNVADFQVWYRILSAASTTQRMTAKQVDAAGLWRSVKSIEICLDLQGDEAGQPNVGSYANCQGVESPRNGRLHLVFRNVFDLRTQGT
jgi:type IV pilus assembly protein PilW